MLLCTVVDLILSAVLHILPFYNIYTSWCSTFLVQRRAKLFIITKSNPLFENAGYRDLYYVLHHINVHPPQFEFDHMDKHWHLTIMHTIIKC